jgi:hypothetical protein
VLFYRWGSVSVLNVVSVISPPIWVVQLIGALVSEGGEECVGVWEEIRPGDVIETGLYPQLV